MITGVMHRVTCSSTRREYDARKAEDIHFLMCMYLDRMEFTFVAAHPLVYTKYIRGAPAVECTGWFSDDVLEWKPCVDGAKCYKFYDKVSANTCNVLLLGHPMDHKPMDLKSAKFLKPTLRTLDTSTVPYTFKIQVTDLASTEIKKQGLSVSLFKSFRTTETTANTV